MARKNWIDCLKGLAILAVAIDHYPYRNQAMMHLSFFSVTLFTLVAGYNAGLSMARRGLVRYDFRTVLRNLWRVFGPYMLAVAVLRLIGGKPLDVGAYLQRLLRFNAQGPYYFILFFLQLVAVAPLLYLLLARGEKTRRPALFWALSAAGMLGISLLCWKYTFVMEIHGGGKYLLGATYLFVYFLGMSLSRSSLPGRRGVTIGAAVLLALCGWFTLRGQELFNLHTWQINPPGLTLILYALAIFLVVCGVVPWLEQKGGRLAALPVRGLALCGRYSMTIFLYHLLVLTRLKKHVLEPLFEGPVAANRWLSLLARAAGYVVIILVPLAGGVLFRLAREKLRGWWNMAQPAAEE